MKKVVWAIIIFIFLLAGIWYVHKHRKVPVDTSITTYINSNLGISFSYPKILSASTTDTSVTLHHEVAFAHTDFCDVTNENASSTNGLINNLTDFNVSFHIDNGNIVDTMQSEAPEIPEQNFVNGAVIPSPGFIDPASFGNLNGFKLSETANGCGEATYFFSVSGERTLVVKQDVTSVFSDAVDPSVQANALAVPDIIPPDSADQIFTSILKTLKVQ